MNISAPSNPPAPYALEFGKYLRMVREEVFNESIRVFAKRLDLSPGYLGRLELAQVGVPRRSTILTLAQHLAMDPDPFLTKGGYAPGSTPDDTEYAYVTMKFRRLPAEQRRIVLDFMDMLLLKHSASEGQGGTSQ